jgi:hypothetical protein
MLGLFWAMLGLFWSLSWLVYTRSLWHTMGLLWHMLGLFWHILGLFWHILGLFWHILGLYLSLSLSLSLSMPFIQGNVLHVLEPLFLPVFPPKFFIYYISLFLPGAGCGLVLISISDFFFYFYQSPRRWICLSPYCYIEMRRGKVIWRSNCLYATRWC